VAGNLQHSLLGNLEEAERLYKSALTHDPGCNKPHRFREY
jgi:hypothetical protein